MTVLEQRFMEQMPRLLHDLLEQVEQLTNEVAELRKDCTICWKQLAGKS